MTLYWRLWRHHVALTALWRHVPAGWDQDRCIKSCPTLKKWNRPCSVRCISNKTWTEITPYPAQPNYMWKNWKKIIARTHCFMHQRFFRPTNIFNKDAYFLDFRAQKLPSIFFNVNPFYQQALHFVVLNYENQHKKGTCKVSGRSVIFSAF